MNLGNKVKSTIQKRGMNSKELADIVGVTPQAISNMIRNNVKLSNENMLKISQALDMPLDFFISEEYSTLDDFELNKSTRAILADNDLVNYIVFADKAKKENITIEELEDAMQFILNIRKAKVTN